MSLEVDGIEGPVVRVEPGGLGKFRVVTRVGKAVEADCTQVLKIRVTGSGRVDHAWTEPVDPDRAVRLARSVDEQMRLLEPEIRRFLEEVERREPKLDDGECGELVLSAGMIGYDDRDGVPIVSFSLKTSFERNLG